VVITLGAAIEVLCQLIGMDHFTTAGAFNPTAETILLGGLDLYFWLIS
jgi:hypothetical protein